MATIEKEIFRDGKWCDKEIYVVFRDEWQSYWEKYCKDELPIIKGAKKPTNIS